MKYVLNILRNIMINLLDILGIKKQTSNVENDTNEVISYIGNITEQQIEDENISYIGNIIEQSIEDEITSYIGDITESEEIIEDEITSYIGDITEPIKEIEDESIPIWKRIHEEDPDVEVASYIKVDIANPWGNYEKNSIKCLNGTFKEEFSVLQNDLVTFAGPYGDNIWLGKKVGEGYVILVGPNYNFYNNKNCYTIIKVKVYNSEEDSNSYLGI